MKLLLKQTTREQEEEDPSTAVQSPTDSGSSRPSTQLATDFHRRPSSRHLESRQQQTVLITSDRHWCLGYLSLWMRGIPAVLIGVLLNVLDAASYGILLFPVQSLPQYFPAGIMAMAGMSLFMISTVISQLVYSTFYGSAFGGGNGSMMVEVLPFLHAICRTVVSRNVQTPIGDGDEGNLPILYPGVISTVLLIYALSTILTGICFWVLGYFKCGNVVNFFPRPFLVGIIGGIGVFLIRTALEIASDEIWEWEWTFFKHLFQWPACAIWSVSLALTLILKVLQTRVWPNKAILVPAYYIILIGVFYIVLFAAGISVETARENNWIMTIEVPEGGHFYDYWKYFDIYLIDWGSIVATLPTVFALILFSILHVPINLPALALSTGVDDLDINRELMGHGVSNLLSGFMLSVQNYMVYCNSVLFIRAGGDSRIAGTLLAIFTAIVCVLGMQLLQFLPTIAVCGLIMQLGLDLLSEAVVEPRKRMRYMEYGLVCVTVIIMTVFEFTYGILAGFVLSCLLFVFSYARQTELKVNGHHDDFGSQYDDGLVVIQLQGYMFFGNAYQLSNCIKSLVCQSFRNVELVILDFSMVQDVDFTWIGELKKCQRILSRRHIDLALCELPEHVMKYLSLNVLLCKSMLFSSITSENEDISFDSAEPHEMISYFDHVEEARFCYSRAPSPVDELSDIMINGKQTHNVNEYEFSME